MDRTRQGSCSGASSSLFTLKTSGAPGTQLPQESSGLQGAGFLLFLLVSPQGVFKYCPESRGGLNPNFYRPLPPPLEAPRRGGPEFMLLPLLQLLPLRTPLEGVPLPGGPPKGSSLWYPSWWSPSKELERPDFGTLWEGPGPPRPKRKHWFDMWLFNIRLLITPGTNFYSVMTVQYFWVFLSNSSKDMSIQCTKGCASTLLLTAVSFPAWLVAMPLHIS